MKILHLIREWAEARNATRARRIYGYITVAFLVAVLVWITETRSPLWVFWAVVAADLVVDTVLVRRWMVQDLLARAGQGEP